MHVASKKKKVMPARLMPEPLFLRHPAGLCPPAEHFLAMIPTKWGVCGVVWKHSNKVGAGGDFASRPANAVLCRVIPPGLAINELRGQILAEYKLCDEVLGDGHGEFHPEIVPDWFGELVTYLQSYYANTLRDRAVAEFIDQWTVWESRLDWSCLTEFQRSVLKIVAKIGRGERRTYGQIAKLVGKPQASRAVGAALGANPWPVLVPCHRVVGADGKMTGFSAPGGVTVKKKMLEMEDGQ